VFVGANCVVGRDPADIVAGAERMVGKESDWAPPFGDGNAAEYVLNELGFADREAAPATPGRASSRGE